MDERELKDLIRDARFLISRLTEIGALPDAAAAYRDEQGDFRHVSWESWLEQANAALNEPHWLERERRFGA